MTPLLLLLLVNYSDSARILGAVFTPSYSHQVAFQPIWRELSLRGHQVTVLTTNPLSDSSLTNLTEIDLSMSYDIMKSYKADELLSTTEESAVARMKKYMEALHVVADQQLEHPQVQDLIRNHRNDFDLLMVEAIYPTQMAFSWWFNVPFIGMISLDAPSRIHAAVGNPIHPVLYPDYDLPFDKDLSFWERLASTLFLWFMLCYGELGLHPREEVTLRKHFGEEVPRISEIQTNMSLLFVNVNPIFHNIRPTGPATIQIGGGLHLQQPKAIGLEIQTYLDNSKKGFVYFSLGTNVKSSALLPKVKKNIVEALAELPYNVLWKFEDDHIPDLPENVKVVTWVSSQTAVLAHPNIKAFVTQCGLQSMEEAIVHRVPMVGMPFYGDQGNNAKILESKGLGVRIQPSELTKEQFKAAVLKVTSDPSYRRNLEEIAELYADEMVTGLEKAVWWSEYVIRHKGAAHLRSPAIDVPLYQYLLLDVIAFLLGALVATILVVKFVVTAVYKLLFLGKVKSD